MKKHFLFIGLILAVFSSCKEESLIEENPAPSGDNVEWNLVTYYGDRPVDFDSVYINATGVHFMLDTISLLVGDIGFYDRNLEMELDTGRNFFMLSNLNPTKRSGRLPAAGYYGSFHMVAGTDSAGAVDNLQEILAIDPSLVREDDYGVDYFRIKGRIFDPTLPIEDSVMIPISYTIGSYLLTDTTVSETRSFSIDNLQQVRIFLLADLKPMLNTLPMGLVQEVESDPTNTQDFTIAQLMADSLSIGIF